MEVGKCVVAHSIAFVQARAARPVVCERSGCEWGRVQAFHARPSGRLGPFPLPPSTPCRLPSLPSPTSSSCESCAATAPRQSCGCPTCVLLPLPSRAGALAGKLSRTSVCSSGNRWSNAGSTWRLVRWKSKKRIRMIGAGACQPGWGPPLRSARAPNARCKSQMLRF
jgi:hypothetical protein